MYGIGAPEVSSGKCEFCNGSQDCCNWLQNKNWNMRQDELLYSINTNEQNIIM
jgi:hypothetical protein